MKLVKTIAAVALSAGLAFAPAAFAANNSNFGQVISSIQASKTGATSIQNMSDVKNVTVVKVADIAQGENMTALDNAVTKNESDILTLRTAMTTNAKVSTALQNAGVDVQSVVAADIGAGDTLTVYVR